MSSKQSYICLALTHSVYTKCESGSDRISENEAKINNHHSSALKFSSLTQCFLVDLSQWLAKYGSKSKQGLRRVKKWPAQRRSKPELCLFNATTACLCLSVA